MKGKTRLRDYDPLMKVGLKPVAAAMDEQLFTISGIHNHKLYELEVADESGNFESFSEDQIYLKVSVWQEAIEYDFTDLTKIDFTVVSCSLNTTVRELE